MEVQIIRAYCHNQLDNVNEIFHTSNSLHIILHKYYIVCKIDQKILVVYVYYIIL